MRAFFASVVVFAATSVAWAQQAAKAPETLLPADAVAYFRYDGYAVHSKAYDQTALAKTMKEGLGDFLDHLFSRAFTLAGDDVPPRNLKKGEGRRHAADRFLDYVWTNGFAASVELGSAKGGNNPEELLYLTLVFPQGAQKKNRQAIADFLMLCANAVDTPVDNAKFAGRVGLSSTFGPIKAHWWHEGEHMMLTLGAEPPEKSVQVCDGKRPNLSSAPWLRELTAFKQYETDMRGRVNLDGIIRKLANIGLEENNLTNVKRRLERQVLLSHLGLTGLKDLTFHLGFDGKYQRSTVRLGVAEPGNRPGLLRLVTGPIAFAPVRLPPLPPDADYVTVRHIDWKEVHDYIRTTYGLLAVARLLGAERPQQFPDLNALLGIDFHKDFLDQLDTTVVSYGAHSEGPFFLGQGFAVKVKDSAKVRKSLQAIGMAIGKIDPMLASEKKTYRGHDIHVFTKAPMPVTYAIHNDWLVVGLLPQPVQGFVMRSGGKYRTWKTPPELATAFGKQNGKGKLIGWSVTDPRPTIEIGLSLMPLFAQYANLGTGFKVVDVNEIPNAQSVNEWLFPNITLAYDDGNALRWEHLYSINEPDDLLLANLLPTVLPWLDLLPFRLPIGRWEAPGAAPKLPGIDVEGPQKPALVPASAIESDGVVKIRLTETRRVEVVVTKTIPETVVEKVVIDGVVKERSKTVNRMVAELVAKDVTSEFSLVADDKSVLATRKTGKAVEPKELPKLLKEETRVLLVRGIEPDAAELRKLDEATLIIRVTPRQTPARDKQPGDPLLSPQPAFPPPIRADDEGHKPVFCPARAVEDNGTVTIQLVAPRLVPYEVTRRVRGAYVDASGAATLEFASGRVFREGAVSKEAGPDANRQVQIPVKETHHKTIMENHYLVADGKLVTVTRKDGKAVEPKELPKLLKKEARVLLVRGIEPDAAVLEKLDENTLIIRALR